jgi:hypothetical protein
VSNSDNLKHVIVSYFTGADEHNNIVAEREIKGTLKEPRANCVFVQVCY